MYYDHLFILIDSPINTTLSGITNKIQTSVLSHDGDEYFKKNPGSW